MRIDWFSRSICEGEMLPAFHGVAWRHWHTNRATTMLIPFNLLASVARDLYLAISFPHPVSSNPRQAYSDGYRDGTEDTIGAMLSNV